MSDGHTESMKALMATPGIDRLKANIEACPDLGVDVEIYVQQRLAAAAKEQANRDYNSWIERHRLNYDRIGKALAPLRSYRGTGEPSLSDAKEIELLAAGFRDQTDKLNATLDRLAAEQKHVALVEAGQHILDILDHPTKHVTIDDADRLRAALTQQDQPAGEWITINEDGSNLPEHVEGATWFCEAEYRGREELEYHPSDGTPKHPGGFGKWDDDLDCFVYMAVQPIAYWSIPHIDRRPDIPEYTAR